MSAAVFEPPWWTPSKTALPRRSLNRQTIVAAARKILQADGIDGVSMRRVAAELGTGPASLYAHVAHKEELLELLLDDVVGEIPLPERPDPARWQEQIRTIWTDSRAALARNGDIARVALGRIPLGPNALRVAEVTTAVLRAGGVPDRTAAWAMDVIGLYVSASAIESAIHVANQRAGRDRAAYLAQAQQHLAALPVDRYPTMAALVPSLMSGDVDERFLFGLDLLIQGLAAQTDPRD